MISGSGIRVSISSLVTVHSHLDTLIADLGEHLPVVTAAIRQLMTLFHFGYVTTQAFYRLTRC
jgi:hypothetical protein